MILPVFLFIYLIQSKTINNVLACLTTFSLSKCISLWLLEAPMSFCLHLKMLPLKNFLVNHDLEICYDTHANWHSLISDVRICICWCKVTFIFDKSCLLASLYFQFICLQGWYLGFFFLAWSWFNFSWFSVVDQRNHICPDTWFPCYTMEESQQSFSQTY